MARSSSPKSSTARTAAAGAVLALGAVATVAPAAFAEPPTQAYAVINAPAQAYIPAGGPFAPNVSYSFADEGAEVPLPENAKLVIDASGLKGIATVQANNEQCTASGLVVTCEDNGNLHGPFEPYTVTPEAGAKPGTGGTVKYEVTADKATSDTAETKLTVGSPQVAVGKIQGRDGLKTGDTVSLPISVKNVGNLATERVDVWLNTGAPGLEFTSPKPKNCRFNDDWDHNTAVYCSFDVALEPGKSATFSTPLRAKVTDQALANWVKYSAKAVSADESRDPNGEVGTDAAITLRPFTGGEFEQGAEGMATYNADNHADFAARGGAIKRDKKDPTTGSVAFGLVNNGPAAAYRHDGKPLVYVDVTLPEGVTATWNRVDEEPDEDATGECLTYVSEGQTKPFEGGHSRYLCPEASTELPGSGQTYSLGVKIAKDAPKDAKGTVKLVPGPAGLDLRDTNTANDTAAITFEGASGSTGGGDSDSTGGSDENGSGGDSKDKDDAGTTGGSDSAGGSTGDDSSDGGSMALTGAAGISLIGGGAALALGLGAGAVVLSRRRATTGASTSA
ncbi:hypothetical protein [Streptomyces palmae]|uniref:Peptidase n=1 Tax=Streptomyces palmae TaxID=1701085 RepID=A0A4Z0GJ92_9ACTN|nr:hypothetical protein [Streptomyces palmae]TGA95992.1 hypothetical protein E4099_24465 [Streptomyces palmae]